ncbi:FusB/FusC family EF-G-binding protein [Bacillus paralicheniformis]|uniref:FusB/FusC family EF-G-binding protein n=1 Tax=Bacillus paralicheniformis TaxID=1648923 RepID=UPI000DA0E089|nr:FusB/FusC family EF-G-binding protein [Bacillus paralicheniformis]MCW4367467.1 FusB/FusC family EF-G-binding protein [Bacillus paralicheniformis]MCY1629507.1 FusB/FusC family EF-G-binding protein [Bacillus paralicheniformis]QSF99310.1 elongation factor G-binding protein [Bacillus paralicheniformis]RZV62686.1 elongation factor G-binding protein [Bacillus paralicheniformis]UWS63667.1 FusB/FusC family EF-G-binding protein [Bacillus paralicheniformis]
MKTHFIRNDQYNFIKFQTDSLVQGHANINDENVLDALKCNALDQVFNLFPDLSSDQKSLLQKMAEVEDSGEAMRFLAELKPHVIPFQRITVKTAKKLFSKVKKLKTPDFEQMDFSGYSYLGWNDAGSGRKYMIVDAGGKLTGIHGTIKSSNKKGICAICNRTEEIGLFMARVKSGKETYTDRGNYICCDSETCNQNVMTLDHLNHFVAQLTKE